MKQALGEALSRAQIIVISGGLGPTGDDVTKEAVSELLERELILNQEIFEKIHRRLSHRIPHEAIVKQARIPSPGEILNNPVGSAPGIILKKDSKDIILLPGVPEELRAMVPQILSYLQHKAFSQNITKSRVLKVWGLGESEVDERISHFMSQANPSVALLAKKDGVHVRITAKFPHAEVDQRIREVEAGLREELGDYVFGTDEEILEDVVGELLKERGVAVSLAESCSGGLISHRLTNVSGISECYICGVVSYSNEAKTDILKVPSELVKDKGAVSEEVALEMARGVRSISGADVALGVTGIAGPAGGTTQKPVGLVFIALSSGRGEICQKNIFSGNRKRIKWKTSQEALNLLRLYLLNKLTLK